MSISIFAVCRTERRGMQIKANQTTTILLNATPKVYLPVSVNIFCSVCAGRWHEWTTHLKVTEVSRYVDGEQLRCGESCSLFTTFCVRFKCTFCSLWGFGF